MWNEKIKEIVSKHDRLYYFYGIGPVQKAQIEDFVDDILKECLKIGMELHTQEVNNGVLPDDYETGWKTGIEYFAYTIKDRFGLN